MTGSDPGVKITIQRFKVRVTPRAPIGRNPIIHPLPDPERSPTLAATKATLLTNTSPTNKETHSKETDTFKALCYTFKFLNSTHPNITRDCWLCPPPHYIGIGTPIPLGTGDNHIQNISHNQLQNKGQRGQHPSLTLGDLKGQGTCFYAENYQVNQSRYLSCCNSTTPIPKTPHLGDTLRFSVPPHRDLVCILLRINPMFKLISHEKNALIFVS